MAAKKISKKEEPKEKEVEKVEKKTSAKYFQGIGRRKAAISQARLFLDGKKETTDKDIVVNGKPYKSFFTLDELRDIVIAPLVAVSLDKNATATIMVKGGGVRGQAEATRLGIARALVKFNEEFRKTLRDLEYLTRDARKVERKKAGLRKARRAPQFSKR